MRGASAGRAECEVLCGDVARRTEVEHSALGTQHRIRSPSSTGWKPPSPVSRGPDPARTGPRAAGAVVVLRRAAEQARIRPGPRGPRQARGFRALLRAPSFPHGARDCPGAAPVPAPGAPDNTASCVLDLGCGTGAAGAAWALVDRCRGARHRRQHRGRSRKRPGPTARLACAARRAEAMCPASGCPRRPRRSWPPSSSTSCRLRTAPQRSIGSSKRPARGITSWSSSRFQRS